MTKEYMGDTLKSLLYQKKYRFLLGIAFLLSILVLFFYTKNPLIPKVQIRNKVFSVDVAITEPQVKKGLGGRQSLSNDYGMLFVFDRKDRYSFWMKDMQFPIDILWINDNKIVDISKNVSVIPEGKPLPTYQPKEVADRV